MSGKVTMKIEYTKTASKFINSMDSNTKSRLKKAVEGLAEKPPKGDIKPLKKYKDGRYRLRMGGYRVIYKFLLDKTAPILYIMDIGVRGDIYK